MQLWYHKAVASPSTDRIYSEEQNTQPSELLTSEKAFGFEIVAQQCQATALEQTIV